MNYSDESEAYEIQFNKEFNNLLIDTKNKIEKYKESIFFDEFTYVDEYLIKYEFYIRSLIEFDKNLIIFLAAAVSDYYIPEEKMNEHKIQSSDDKLNICLFPVKKEL